MDSNENFERTAKGLESNIEKVLMDLELKGDLQGALDAYQGIESELVDLEGTIRFNEFNRVLAYCLMRQSNILRQLGKIPEAHETGELGLQAATLSGDDLTLARNLMDHSANCFVSGKLEKGMDLANEAKILFQKGDSYDHKQGLGWYWILQADLINAGLIEGGAKAAIVCLSRALEVLTPIKNWQGIARAYGSRSNAYAELGFEEQASQDSISAEAWSHECEKEAI